MKDLSIVQHQTELEEKAGNAQHWRRELSMVAQDNDAKHGDVNSRQLALIYIGKFGSDVQARIGSYGQGRIQRNTVLHIQIAINL